MSRRVFVVIAVLLGVASGIGVGSSADIEITLQVPANLDPTILTETDASGEVRVERAATRVFKLVNFDETVAFVLSPDPVLTTPNITVCNKGGGNGDDAAGPWPLLDVVWTYTNGSTSQDTLSVDECSSCSTCDLSTSWQP